VIETKFPETVETQLSNWTRARELDDLHRRAAARRPGAPAAARSLQAQPPSDLQRGEGRASRPTPLLDHCPELGIHPGHQIFHLFTLDADQQGNGLAVPGDE
jgi:hypothetical protein